MLRPYQPFSYSRPLWALAPHTPPVGTQHAASLPTLLLFTAFVGACAPHPAARGPALLHLPLGPLHIPKPLAMITSGMEQDLPIHAHDGAAGAVLAIIKSHLRTAVARKRHDK
jgi:hypothetical protein